MLNENDIEQEVERRIAERESDAAIWELTFRLIFFPFRFRLFRVAFCCILAFGIVFNFSIVPVFIWVDNTFKTRMTCSLMGNNDDARKEYARFGQTPWWDENNENESSEAKLTGTAFSFSASDGRLVTCNI